MQVFVLQVFVLQALIMQVLVLHELVSRAGLERAGAAQPVDQHEDVLSLVGYRHTRADRLRRIARSRGDDDQLQRTQARRFLRRNPPE